MPIDYSTYYTEGTFAPYEGGRAKYVPDHDKEVSWILTGNSFGLLFHIIGNGRCVATVIARKSSDGDNMVLFNRHLVSVDSIPIELFNKVFKEVEDPAINSKGEKNADN